MGCLKGESEVKKKGAKFECGKCGAKTSKKGHVCKPVEIAESKKSTSKDGKNKGSKKKK